MAPGFAGENGTERVLMWEHFGSAAIRQGNWKLVRFKNKGPWELYDLEKDRSELNNLVKLNPGKAKVLEELWEKEAHRTLIYPRPVDKKKK